MPRRRVQFLLAMTQGALVATGVAFIGCILAPSIIPRHYPQRPTPAVWTLLAIAALSGIIGLWWSAIVYFRCGGQPWVEDSARCPHCGYPKRGLPEPRCPECGEPFEREP